MNCSTIIMRTSTHQIHIFGVLFFCLFITKWNHFVVLNGVSGFCQLMEADITVHLARINIQVITRILSLYVIIISYCLLFLTIFFLREVLGYILRFENIIIINSFRIIHFTVGQSCTRAYTHDSKAIFLKGTKILNNNEKLKFIQFMANYNFIDIFSIWTYHKTHLFTAQLHYSHRFRRFSVFSFYPSFFSL